MVHDVTFTIPERELGRADIEVKVKKGKKMGTLKISKGSLVWVPKKAQYGFKVRWSELDSLMRQNGKHEKS